MLKRMQDPPPLASPSDCRELCRQINYEELKAELERGGRQHEGAGDISIFVRILHRMRAVARLVVFMLAMKAKPWVKPSLAGLLVRGGALSSKGPSFGSLEFNVGGWFIRNEFAARWK